MRTRKRADSLIEMVVQQAYEGEYTEGLRPLARFYDKLIFKRGLMNIVMSIQSLAT